MKKKLFTFLALTLLVCSNYIFAQKISDIAEFMQGGQTNANKLSEAYLEPFCNMLGADLNGGWYNTAKPHALGGFDITISTSLSIAPSSDEKFSLNDLGITDMVADQDLSSFTGDGSRASLTYNDIEFDSPEGMNFNVIPLIMPQIGIGLIKETELVIRYMPSIELVGDAGKIGLFGIGIKHSLKQWIPVLSKVPFLQLSAFVGYTKLSANSDINFKPSYNSTEFDGQELNISTSALTTNIIASGKLPIIPLTIYGGLGYSMTKTNILMKGKYALPSSTNEDNIITDPINLDIENQSSIRFNAGIRLNILVFITFHLDYTYANYSVYTAGLGFSFR